MQPEPYDDKRFYYIPRRLMPVECARLQGFPDDWGVPNVKEDFTDEECTFWLNVCNTYERANGRIAGDYTKNQMLNWYNRLHSEKAEYKMWGNGVAAPAVHFIMQEIAEVTNSE